MTEIAAMHARIAPDATLILADGVELAQVEATVQTAPKAHHREKALSPSSQDQVDELILTSWTTTSGDSVHAVTLWNGAVGNTAVAELMAGLKPMATRIETDLPRKTNLIRSIAAGVAKVKESSGSKGITQPPSVNSFFNRAVVLNLDRRPDRWAAVSKQLQSAGIVAERFSAVDGQDPKIADEYAAYAAQPLHCVSDDLPPIKLSADLYMNYASQMARIAHLEETSKKKAVGSAGAWGYLKSYEAILEKSLADGDETLLVFDDDVCLHKDFQALFERAGQQLPEDWLIVQLGTLQHNWNYPSVDWHSPMLYKTNGVAIGSNAVGMRFEVLPYLLDHTKRFDMPYDIGPLSSATRAFADRCFIVYPNLAIQTLGVNDIGTSEFQKFHSADEITAVYRWNLDDYVS